MREVSKDARELLALAGEIARIRSAPECTSRDLAIAAVAYRLIAAERDPENALPSLSPEMLPLGAPLERVLTGTSGSVEFSELRELAARENPDLAEYLGTA
ncbi:hypothetical protein J7I98_19875 [Streptomyces sp. ISL-98]|uniref:hypothetical protein n=1 Tax=Streptomyces sp. ISL-98 TaxID=2819192 RepID=UPI001BEC639F|nr:hypothetical protein [Streptomyces sp. ISL-98]MBT2508104.1 hypothetical protein [Streptomyces sp. ISL-98]